MTGVLEPTAAAADQKPLAGVPDVKSSVADNVRFLDTRRIRVAPRTDVEAAPVPVTGRERVGVQFLSRIRAWMVVPVVDFALMVAPLAWRPPQIDAIRDDGGPCDTSPDRRRPVRRTSTSSAFWTSCPRSLTRLLTAVAAVSAVILYLHQNAAGAGSSSKRLARRSYWSLLAVSITTRLIAIGRRSGITQHHTVLIGGGPVATELARILAQHKSTDSRWMASSMTATAFPAGECMPRLGRARRPGHGDADIGRRYLAGRRWRFRGARVD